jgi:hypothetical protein
MDLLMIFILLAGVVLAFHGLVNGGTLILIVIYLPASVYSLFTGAWRKGKR